MFKRIDCVCVHTTDLGQSLTFYVGMGLSEAWRLERMEGDVPWTLVGLDFPTATAPSWC